jgi:hypothetical protein
MALHPECDGAIEDVVNEAIVSDCTILLSKLNYLIWMQLIN